jgi:hypothetical protein
MATISYMCQPLKCTFKLVAVLVQADLISVGNCRPPYQQNKGKLTHKHFPARQFSPKHHTGCQFVKLTIDWVYLVSTIIHSIRFTSVNFQSICSNTHGTLKFQIIFYTFQV